MRTNVEKTHIHQSHRRIATKMSPYLPANVAPPPYPSPARPVRFVRDPHAWLARPPVVSHLPTLPARSGRNACQARPSARPPRLSTLLSTGLYVDKLKILCWGWGRHCELEGQTDDFTNSVTLNSTCQPTNLM